MHGVRLPLYNFAHWRNYFTYKICNPPILKFNPSKCRFKRQQINKFEFGRATVKLIYSRSNGLKDKALLWTDLLIWVVTLRPLVASNKKWRRVFQTLKTASEDLYRYAYPLDFGPSIFLFMTREIIRCRPLGSYKNKVRIFSTYWLLCGFVELKHDTVP